MAILAVNGAVLSCVPFGAAPSTLIVLPTRLANASSMPIATIMDYAPMVNVPSFGMCMSLANPTVAAATAAASGVLTPMPCIPATAAPWVPGSPTVMVGNLPALNNTSKLMCTWGGVIQINVPGQVMTMVP